MSDDVRKMVIGPDKAKDVSSTEVLGGEAESTKAQKETNKTVEYTTGKTAMGALGGEAKH